MPLPLLERVAHGGNPQDPSGSPTEMLRKRQLLHLGKAQDRTGLTAPVRFYPFPNLTLKSSLLTEKYCVWSDMIVNEMSPEEIADSKDLPIAAVKEAIIYCETNRELLEQEAKAERRCSSSSQS